MALSEPIDLQFLDSTCDYDLVFRDELMEGYLSETERDLANLQADFSAQSFSNIMHIAHRIKGSSSRVGAYRMHDFAFVLENAFREQSSSLGAASGELLEQVPGYIEALHSEFKAVKNFWEQQRSALSTI